MAVARAWFSCTEGVPRTGTKGSGKARAKKSSDSVGCAEKAGCAGGGETFGTVRLTFGPSGGAWRRGEAKASVGTAMRTCPTASHTATSLTIPPRCSFDPALPPDTRLDRLACFMIAMPYGTLEMSCAPGSVSVITGGVWSFGSDGGHCHRLGSRGKQSVPSGTPSPSVSGFSGSVPLGDFDGVRYS